MKTWTKKYVASHNVGFADFINKAVEDGSMCFQLEAYLDAREGKGRVYVPGTFGAWTQDNAHSEEWDRDGLHVKMDVCPTDVYDKTCVDINRVEHWLDRQFLLKFTLSKIA